MRSRAHHTPKQRDNERFERFLNIAWKQADEDKSGSLDVRRGRSPAPRGGSREAKFFFLPFFFLSFVAAIDRLRSNRQIAELGDTLDVFFNSDTNDKPLSKDDIAALIQRFDKDGSKTVTKDEFRQILKDYLAASQ